MSRFSIENYFGSFCEHFSRVDIDSIYYSIELIRQTSLKGKTIFTCGNGGSSHTANHYITDWNKSIGASGSHPFRGISLSSNIGLITAFGNDVDYSDVFSGQLLSLMTPGDLLICVSGSGNSPNILRAIDVSHQLGGLTLGIVGYDGGKMLGKCTHHVHYPSFDMQLCEDFHLMYGHIVMRSFVTAPCSHSDL
jgi:D-sedoheptulose 7-phosphate isomerase